MSNQALEDATDVLSERLTAAEPRIGKAEEYISVLNAKEKSLRKKVQ